MFRIYTDGACHAETRRGGWAAILVSEEGERVLKGSEANTTSNRMELTAAIKGLEATPEGAEATVLSDSQYLVFSMTRGWQRKANLDLWQRLDELVARRRVSWEWVQGHTGNTLNERANQIAGQLAGTLPEPKAATAPASQLPTTSSESALSHLDAKGQARMVDVGWKPDTEREAVARGFVSMKPETLRLITAGRVEKGDVLAAARIAGVMAAKRTPDLIPLCHPLPITHASVELEPDEARSGIQITATVKTTAKTGVEMEALTAVAVAALTIYDMAKAVDRAMRIEAVRLVRKSGGKSGDIVLVDPEPGSGETPPRGKE